MKKYRKLHEMYVCQAYDASKYNTHTCVRVYNILQKNSKEITMLAVVVCTCTTDFCVTSR